jgi:hypothetical protein
VNLRRVDPPGAPLTPEDLQARGDELVGLARTGGLEAIRMSITVDFLEKGKLNLGDIRRWREHARAAATAWALVDATTSEILTEYERSAAALRGDGA